MGAGIWLGIGGAVVAVLVLGVLAATVISDRRAMRARLDESRTETAELRARLDDMSRQMVLRVPTTSEVEFLITDAGELVERDQLTVVPDKLVLSATLGEPLVKVVSFGHGLRRALSAESRNRIRFEIRKEVRRARKQRRADMKAVWREHKAGQRAGDTSEDAA